MKIIKVGALAAAAVWVLALGACNSSKDAPPADQASRGPAAVTVNGNAISQRTVDLVAKQGAASGRPDTPETRKEIIDQLTLQMVAAEAATKKGLDKLPEVADQIEATKRSVLASAYVQDFMKTNVVTDDMVKAEYDRIKATVTGTEYKARHILVEKESDAKDLIARLKKEPGAFAQLAKQKSKDTRSGANGGDLGWFDLSRMVPEFGAAVSKLEKGKITPEPVKTQFGYHVILLEDSKPIEAPPLEEVKPQLTQRLQQQSLKKQLDELKAGAKIEIAGAAAPAPATVPSGSAK